MTPKEKANELVVRFMQYVPAEETFELPYSKQCALIAVDEVLNISYFTNEPTEEDELYKNYWLQVKDEIEKL